MGKSNNSKKSKETVETARKEKEKTKKKRFQSIRCFLCAVGNADETNETYYPNTTERDGDTEHDEDTSGKQQGHDKTAAPGQSYKTSHGDAGQNKAIVEVHLQQPRDQQARNQQARDQQTKEQQAREQQAREQQAREQQAKDQQAREQQARQQQARDQQAKEQQARDQQARDQQAKEQQARDQQAREQQARQQQARDQQAKEQQARDQQARDQQARDQQAKEQQARDQQARDQQARNQQAKEQQARDQQAREQQAREQQTRDQQAREQQAREQPTAGNSNATGFHNKHREETRLDINCQRTSHVPASTTSAAQPLNEVNSASSTRRYVVENNAEVKSQHVDPHIQRMHVPAQNHQLSLASQHYAQQHSFKQESVPSHKAKLSYIRPGNILSPILSTFREDSSERQKESVTRAINCGPKPGIPTINKQLTENKFCLAKAVDDVNKTNEKMPNYESPHDTSADTIQKRSMTNHSYPKPSVELSIDQNSGGQLYDADIVNKKETPGKRLNTVCDSEAAQSESSIEGKNKKILDDNLIATDDTGCTVEQLPEITSNLDTREVHYQDKDGFAVTQTEWETYETISIEMKEYGGKPRPGLLAENSYTMHAQADEDYVESIATPNDNISKAGDENVDWLFNKEPSNWKDALSDETCDWKTADFGDMEVTIDQIVEDEQNSWKAVLPDETYDWKNAEFGGMETTFDMIVEDNQNDWKVASIDDWRAAEFGETDKTNGKTFEDKHNRLEAATDDKMELARTEMPNDYNSSGIDCRAADAWSASLVENHLNEVNEQPDRRVESGLKEYSRSNLIFARNYEKVEECFEELRKAELARDQPLSSFETNTSEVSSVFTDKSDIDSGMTAEGVSTGTEVDLNTAERDGPHGFKRDEDKPDGAVVEGHQSGAEEQDIASIQQNTKTGPVNDPEEKQVPSSTASVAQTPHEKVSDASAIEKENEIQKRKEHEEKPKEITKPIRAIRPVGLQNLGNTCFFNAVMQNLNQSFLLNEVLAEKGLKRLSLTKSMVKFYDRMRSGASSTVTPSEVLSNICRRSPRFAGGRQQDSHELLRHLLDGLRNEERESLGNPNNRKILTKVDKVFGGHFMTVYTCKDCKTPYHVCEPMLDISLPIAYEDFENDEESSVNEEDNETAGDGMMYQKVAESLMTPLAIAQKKDALEDCNECRPESEVPQLSKKQKEKNKRKSKVQHSPSKKSRTEGRTILDCLDAFTRTEHIADEYLCMACHAERANKGATDYQMTSAKKRTLIYNPPALLTLHLKRFEQTPYGFVKCNDRISFQDMIDIGPYCSSWCMRNEGNEKSIWYSLYGLVVHGGSLDGGHYIAYVKLRETDDNIRQFLQKSYLDRDELTQEKLEEMMKLMHDLPKQKWQPEPVNGTWFYISDSHSSKVSENEVWQQQAYLLFYERMQGKNRFNKSICYQRPAVNSETSV